MDRETPRKDRLCGMCVFFRQHYVKLGRRYVPVDYGHCAHPSSASRRSAAEVCPRWQAAVPTEK